MKAERGGQGVGGRRRSAGEKRAGRARIGQDLFYSQRAGGGGGRDGRDSRRVGFEGVNGDFCANDKNTQSYCYLTPQPPLQN